MHRLDDPDEIKSVDRSGMLGLLDATPEHYLKALELGEKVSLEKLEGKTRHVAFLGMGGSSIGGCLLKDWGSGEIPVPLVICREAVIPRFIDKHTLVFAISYSGNTQETLYAFLQALKRKSHVVGISSGGLLREYCRREKVMHVTVPTGFQPRLSLPYLFTTPCIILQRLRIAEGIGGEIKDAVESLRKVRDEVKVSTPTDRNLAKAVALRLEGTLPVIYGFREYTSVAYRFKTQLNENSKTFCKHDVLPELDHNEVVGWDGVKPSMSKLSVILLRDRDEPQDIRVRFEVLKEIIHGKASGIHEIYGEGTTKLARMLSTLYIGDYISFYLAVLNRVDPTPVDTISFLKREVEKRLG